MSLLLLFSAPEKRREWGLGVSPSNMSGDSSRGNGIGPSALHLQFVMRCAIDILLSVKDKNKNYRLSQNTHRLIMNTPYLFSNTPYLLRSKLAEKYSAIYLVFHSLLRIFAA